MDSPSPAAADRYELLAPDCVAEDFDGEIVVVNLNTGRYFSLRGLGAAVWHDLIAGHRATDIRNAVAAGDPTLAGPASLFIESLVENQLLRASTTVASAPAELRCAEAVRGGDKTLLVEAYDDMKDLLQTDPIHDVDPEIGWPVRR